MKLVALMVIITISVVAGSPPRPVYSSRYANVYYQRADPDTKQTFAPAEEIIATAATAAAVGEISTSVAATTTEKPDGGGETTIEPESEQINVSKDQVTNDKLTEVKEEEGLSEEAVYYIYHPTDGLLQRVVYLAKDDRRNMAYTAQFKYQNVEPIREPIYTYDSETFVLHRLQV